MCKFIVFVVQASNPSLAQIGRLCVPLQITFTKLGCSRNYSILYQENCLNFLNSLSVKK
jgi:hypothetical protein